MRRMRIKALPQDIDEQAPPGVRGLSVFAQERRENGGAMLLTDPACSGESSHAARVGGLDTPWALGGQPAGRLAFQAVRRPGVGLSRYLPTPAARNCPWNKETGSGMRSPVSSSFPV